MSKIIIIEKLDEGFMIIGGDGKTSAIPDPDTLMRRLEAEFGFSDPIRPVRDDPELVKIVDDTGKIITSPRPSTEFKRQEADARPVTKAPPAKAEVTRPETQDIPGSNPGGATSNFIFKEAPPFDWHTLPEKGTGKSTYRQQGDRVRITREGYTNAVFANIKDLKALAALKHPGYIRHAVIGLHNVKRTLIYSFLREVDISKLEPVAGKPALDEEHDPDRPYRAFGLNRLTKTSGDGEKIEQEFIDEIEKAEAGGK